MQPTHRAVLAFSILLATGASAASAAELALLIGPNRGATAVDAVVAPGSGEQFFDFTFLDTVEPPLFEGLVVYELMVRAPRPGITLLRAEVPDNWVFAGTDASFTVTEAAPDHLLITVTDVDDPNDTDVTLVDIVTGRKAARVYYGVDAAALPGLYNITLDPQETAWGHGLPKGFLLTVDTPDPGVVRVTPEPAGLALLGIPAALALRRRRPCDPHHEGREK